MSLGRFGPKAYIKVEGEERAASPAERFVYVSGHIAVVKEDSMETDKSGAVCLLVSQKIGSFL